MNLRNIGKGQQDDPKLTKVREWIVSKAKPTKLELRGRQKSYINMPIYCPNCP